MSLSDGIENILSRFSKKELDYLRNTPVCKIRLDAELENGHLMKVTMQSNYIENMHIEEIDCDVQVLNTSRVPYKR